MKKTLSKEKWFLLAIVLLFIVASVIALSQKANLHVDEVYTYGLSNHPYDGKLHHESGRRKGLFSRRRSLG